jgi:2'-5' RNA ligase
MKRLFAAIKIHPSQQFLSIYDQLIRDFRHDNIKFVERENIHITLKFFGETDEQKIPAICKIFMNVVAKNSSFILKINRTGIFGSSYQPKVIWFGIDENPLLQKLFWNIAEELQNIGYETDRQNFVPHLTIGRIRYITDKKLFQQTLEKYKTACLQDTFVNSFTLYESILRREGPLYKIIEHFDFPDSSVALP